MSNQNLDTDRLAELVNCKHAVLVQLRTLAQRELELASEGEARAMISLMAVKQSLIDNLMRVERQLDPFRSQQPNERAWRSAEDRTTCAAASQQCQQILDEVMALDRQSMEILQARQHKTKVQVDSAHQGASVRSAYLADGPTARSMDLTSEG